jgi:hypothetical protein
VNSRLVTITTGIAAIKRKGFLRPNFDFVASDLNPTIGPQIASQMDPIADIVPATAGLTPATVVKYNSK